MKKEDVLLPKKITIIDKIKKTFRKVFGYKEGKRFMIDVQPILRNYTDINLMKISTIEERLKKVLDENKEQQSLVAGIKESEAEILLEWVVQNAREGFQIDSKESIKDMSLFGCCGLGQGITGYTLQNMGLSPNINNVTPTLAEKGGRHAFVTVNIPIKNAEGVIDNRLYLVDTTYRQFFLRNEVTPSCGEYIEDKKFGNRVAPLAGYWVLRMKNGVEFAQELLEKGFIEFTEENAKIYGDGFVLEEKERKDYTKVPSKEEMRTQIEGKTYISNVSKLENQEEIDYEREDFDKFNINIKTPLMKKEDILKSIENVQNQIKEKSMRQNENVKEKETEDEIIMDF